MISVAVPCKDEGLLVALQSGIYRLNSEDDAQLVCHPEVDRPDYRYNDGKCDTHGRFWVGSLSTTDEPDAGRLWKVEHDGSFVLIEEGLGISNGLGWSPDDQYFYLTDSKAMCIYRYDYNSRAGTLNNRAVLKKFDGTAGVPDGLCVDKNGRIWCAMWDGGAVLKLSPEGDIEARIPMPVPRPTSCALGVLPARQMVDAGSSARDSTTVLFITSARIGLSDESLNFAPLSGCMFSVPVDAVALPETVFG